MTYHLPSYLSRHPPSERSCKWIVCPEGEGRRTALASDGSVSTFCLLSMQLAENCALQTYP
ncbi:hypothetical protein BO86DRAFT_387243 [Aspergillus japonicus CBS 114.51]|uniref:Uncharacterized protein n=1 Tax=Aspergillus japonicus CBS 114.51 TaxID=1448312 RepID=A0A8T8X9M8_ASPJA|nr:hypothetical protein BO86DRAFT_387243 [Aspergillus japonicus CBS 114.51]RAH84129.1 hypothetical protein BO86DRAFT_387243 [Aspergillus japonicus CBS 114.51]